jgi:putative membrane protein
MYRFGQHAHHPLFGVLFLILVAALVVLAVLAVVRHWRTGPGSPGSPATGSSPRPGAPGPGADPALAELRLRYARGEITSEEYLQRVAGLGYQLPPGAVPGGPFPMAPPAV